jgi:hypothetical protein
LARFKLLGELDADDEAAFAVIFFGAKRCGGATNLGVAAGVGTVFFLSGSGGGLEEEVLMVILSAGSGTILVDKERSFSIGVAGLDDGEATGIAAGCTCCFLVTGGTSGDDEERPSNRGAVVIGVVIFAAT